MGERERRRAQELAKPIGPVPAVRAVPPVPVVVVPTWECHVYGKHKIFVPRGEACPECGKRLLEG